MQYLVTGATGFLGAHLTDSLLARGHRVVALSRGAHRLAAREGVTALKGDVLDKESVQSAAQGCDGVFHCAGRVSRDPDDAEILWRTHVEGTRNTLEAARTAGVKRAVVASTSGTIAISEDPAVISREDDPTPYTIIQRFAYYRAKLYAEKEALAQNRDGLDVVVVNPSLLLGPGDTQGSSTDDVKKFIEGKIPFVPAGGMAYVDARDAAEGMVMAMEKGTAGRRYLLSGSNCTVSEFFGRLERVSGVRAPWVPLPKSVKLARAGATVLDRAMRYIGSSAPVDPETAEMSQLFWYVDSSRAESELGWKPRDPIATLHDTVEWLRR